MQVQVPVPVPSSLLGEYENVRVVAMTLETPTTTNIKLLDTRNESGSSIGRIRKTTLLFSRENSEGTWQHSVFRFRFVTRMMFTLVQVVCTNGAKSIVKVYCRKLCSLELSSTL